MASVTIFRWSWGTILHFRGEALLDQRRGFYLAAIRSANIYTILVAIFIAAHDARLFNILLQHTPNIISFSLLVVTAFFLFRAFISLLFKRFHQNKGIISPSAKYEISTSCVIILVMALCMLFVRAIFYRFVPIPFSFILLFMAIAIVATSAIVLCLRFFLSLCFNRKLRLRNIVIVGSNPRAMEFADSVAQDKMLGIRVVGFVDDYDYNQSATKFLGKLENLQSIIGSQVIHAVVIHLPIRSFYDQIRSIINTTKEQGVQVYYLSSLFEHAEGSMRLSDLYGVPSIMMTNSPNEDWRLFIKRCMDIAMAFPLLILTSPIVLASALAIKITSPGPIFFIQDRVGHYKKTFKLVKLRTMVHDAEAIHKELENANQMDGPVFKIENDPRISRVGRFLRRFAIDELPQLINVLKNDMSMVGPRPLALRDYNGFSEDWLRRRFSVKPGLTCTWQSIPFRNKLTFKEWMELDMEYIDNWSLFLDFRIMLKTIPTVFRGKGV